MWSNVVSIDKRYEREISYVLDRIENTKDVSYAIEESMDRIFVYLASACENAEAVEENVRDAVCTVVLDFFKMRFFAERLRLARVTLAECALISSMVHFDRDFERALLHRTFASSLNYNIDGVYNFRLAALRDSWGELAEVAEGLLDGVSAESEIFDIASFITGSDGGKNQLVLERGRLKNITCHKNVEVINLFDIQELNLLSAILGERPQEILVRHGELSAPLCSTLKRIARVIER